MSHFLSWQLRLTALKEIHFLEVGYSVARETRDCAIVTLVFGAAGSHGAYPKILCNLLFINGVPKWQPNHRLLLHKDNGNLIIEMESRSRDDTEKKDGIH